MDDFGLDFSSLLVRDVCDDPVEWLQANVYLDSIVSPNAPGQLSLVHQPWARKIIEDVLNPDIQHITLCTGAQTGKSLLMQLAYLLLCKFSPQPSIIAFPDDGLAERFVKTRLKPLINCNPDFAAKLPPHQRVGQKNMLFIDGMPTFYTGCRSPQKLCSMPAAYIFLDEAAKLVKNKSSEAHPYKLLLERNKSFALHKIIEASTPAAETDPFWESLQNSSWQKYLVPCPWCGEMMEFQFDKEHLKWVGETQEEIVKSTRIICDKCACELDDAMRREAMKHGQWVASNPAHEQGHSGYHINSLYSCWKSIGEVAWEFIKSNRSIMRAEALHNFHNSWLALPWTDYKSSITEDDVKGLVDLSHHRGTIPDDMIYLALGADPGQAHTHYIVVAVCAGGVLKVVDWGQLSSVSSDKGKHGLQWLLENQTYTTTDGMAYKIDIGYCDSGYMTGTVYDECRAGIQGLLSPTKGSGATGTYGRSVVKNNDMELIIYSDFAIKTELYNNLYRAKEVVLPRDADNELIAGLSGQKMIVDKSGKKHWQKVDNDHYGDCLKLCLLSMWVASENDEIRKQIRPSAIVAY